MSAEMAIDIHNQNADLVCISNTLALIIAGIGTDGFKVTEITDALCLIREEINRVGDNIDKMLCACMEKGGAI